MLVKFGKSSDALLNLKSDFFENNDQLKDYLTQIANHYRVQPARRLCKICSHELSKDETGFEKNDIPYYFCKKCNHLNGNYEDTDNFCSFVYTEQGGESYAANYQSQDREKYSNRVNNIYLPKALFLQESLEAHEPDPLSLAIADLGAGSGYFVSALRQAGFKDAMGFEVSETQVTLANHMIGNNAVHQHDMEAIFDIIKNTQTPIVSMIGVLEHLQQPMQVLKQIQNNANIRYIYLSVPLFSFCVYLEMLFPEVMPRHLAGGHTHLFTDDSLKWIESAYQFERISAWWFGTDMVDLFRNVSVMLHKKSALTGMTDYWQNSMKSLLDPMQLVLDQQRQSSEVHLLWRIR